MANIYIVEDDTNIQEIEAIALKNSGHSVEQFDDAAHFYKKLEEKLPDLAILDLMLPDEDGYEIVKKLRQNPATKKLPVIMVTAKTSEIDMVRGLDIGADDYIKKPFSIIEFITRVKAILRRTLEQPDDKYMTIGDIFLDNERHVVYVDNKGIELTYNFLCTTLELFLPEKKSWSVCGIPNLKANPEPLICISRHSVRSWETAADILRRCEMLGMLWNRGLFYEKKD